MVNQIVSKSTFSQRQNMSKELVTYIKQQILSGELNPGDRIVETKIARELGISQTPVREALRELQGQGIITVVPNRGPLVRSLSKEDAFEVYSLRSMLEGMAIRLAVKFATDEEVAELENVYHQMDQKVRDDSVDYLFQYSSHLHELIIKYARHSRISTFYDSISLQIALLNRQLGMKKSKDYEVNQHWELIEVMKARDPDAAELTMRKHIYRSYCDFVDYNQLPKEEVYYDVKAWL